MRGVEIVSGAGLEPGTVAPDFDLPVLRSGVKGRLRLSEELLDHCAVLAFYPGNWEEASTQQMRTYQAALETLRARQATVVAICVDSIMNTTVWEREIGPFDFPLCSDFWPHGEVSRAYEVLRTGGPGLGHCERAVFVIGRSGSILFRKLYRDQEAPPMADIFEVLAECVKR